MTSDHRLELDNLYRTNVVHGSKISDLQQIVAVDREQLKFITSNLYSCVCTGTEASGLDGGSGQPGPVGPVGPRGSIGPMGLTGPGGSGSSVEAYVGTKPTVARPLTEVELAPLVSGYSSGAGESFEGGVVGFLFGSAVAISKDGKTFAACTHGGGITKVYSLVEDPAQPQYGQWSQWGDDITMPDTINLNGLTTPPGLDLSVALSYDGTTLAIGNASSAADTADAHVGRVWVYQRPSTAAGTWDSNSSNNPSGNIDGWTQSNDNGGAAVAMNSDGTIIAIGAPGNDTGAETLNGPDAGLVKVWQYTEPYWGQMGAAISGSAAGDESGTSLAMSADGHTLAVGSPNHDGVSQVDVSTHTYFGLAPTAENQGWASWFWLKNFKIMQGTQDIIDFADGLSPHTVGSPNFYYGSARPNWTYVVSIGADGSRQRHAVWGVDDAYLTHGDAPRSNYSNHWELHQEPIFYTQSDPVDGSELTAKIWWYSPPHYYAPGHIVSAASPEGPWVIRGSWTSEDPTTASVEVLLSQTPVSTGATTTPDSLALSHDGERLLIGSPTETVSGVSSAGCVRVYQKPVNDNMVTSK